MRKIILVAGLILLAVSMSNCASIVHGNSQTVDFSSQPAGAKVFLDGRQYGTTPTSVVLKRIGRLKDEPTDKLSYQVKIDLDGYYPYEIQLKRTVDGWL